MVQTRRQKRALLEGPSKIKRKRTIPKKKAKKAVKRIRQTRRFQNLCYLGKREEFSEDSNKPFKINKLFDYENAAEPDFKIQMNKLLNYPKNLNLNYLTSLKEITTFKGSLPDSILITTFGYEKEFIKFLLEESKVKFDYYNIYIAWLFLIHVFIIFICGEEILNRKLF
jgi:hypothetical protein